MRKLPFSSPGVNGALFSLLVFNPLVNVDGSDWPHYRGPNRDGISEESGLRKKGKAPVLWEKSLGLGYSSPVVAAGRVVVSGHDGAKTDSLFCFDEATGDERWKYSYEQPVGDLYFQGGTTGTPTIEGGRVYQLAREGDLFCLSLDSGEVIWKKHMQEDFGYSKPTWGFTGSPLVMGDRVYVNAGESGIALDKNSGEAVWKSDNEEAGYSTPYPLLKNGKRYMIFTSKRAYTCVNPDTGERVWSERWMTRYGVNAADPVVSGDFIFISTGYGKGAILLKWSGEGEPEKVWQSREMRTQMNACVLLDGYLYGIDGNEGADGTGLKCIELTSGEVKWVETSVGHGTAVAVKGELLVLTEEGDLQVADASPSGYKPTFSQKVLQPKVWTVPVFANGRVYCRNAAGNLVVLSMKGKS